MSGPTSAFALYLAAFLLQQENGNHPYFQRFQRRELKIHSRSFQTLPNIFSRLQII